MANELTIELLSKQVDALSKQIDGLARSMQSEKDKAIARTNQRIDALERLFAEFLRQEGVNV
jgi:outer membrane murein-binding lipoprotein Lpp